MVCDAMFLVCSRSRILWSPQMIYTITRSLTVLTTECAPGTRTRGGDSRCAPEFLLWRPSDLIFLAEVGKIERAFPFWASIFWRYFRYKAPSQRFRQEAFYHANALVSFPVKGMVAKFPSQRGQKNHKICHSRRFSLLRALRQRFLRLEAYHVTENAYDGASHRTHRYLPNPCKPGH